LNLLRSNLVGLWANSVRNIELRGRI